MKLPRIKAEMSLPEVSAFARLRGALFMDLGERLPPAMRARTADRVSSGKLKADFQEALDKVKSEGFEGEDALILAVGALLLGEAKEVSELLKSEVLREHVTADRCDATIGFCLAPTQPPPSG